MPSSVDIAGALAAIEAWLTANWTATPIAFENLDPADPSQPWPPVDGNGAPVAWVFCELVDVDPKMVGFGKPGSQTIIEQGLIKLYVMVQKGGGLADARVKATALGEIFRQKEFFNSDPTARVRTRTPRVGRDPLISEDGNSICGASCSVPYEFWHQA
jgi:hypothetical protein